MSGQTFNTQIENSIKSIGIINTARNLGYDVSSYKNLKDAGRLLMLDVKNHAPSSIKTYLHVMKDRLNKNVYTFIKSYSEELQSVLDSTINVNYKYDFFSAATEIKTYLPKFIYDENSDDFTLNVCETPQLQALRIASELYWDVSLDRVIKAYHEISQQYYTHATPTIFNAGMRKNTMVSCYLLNIEDNLDNIAYTAFGDASIISKCNGGLGIDISRLRHSEIDNKGMSQGIIPMAQVVNSIVRYVDQGGMRKGAATLCCDVFHIDIMEFISLVDKIGEQYTRAHDINISIWMPSLFFKRYLQGGNWTMFCPAKAKELLDIFGPDFDREYEKLEELAKLRDEELIYRRNNYNLLKQKIQTMLNVSDEDIIEFHEAREQYQEAVRRKINHKTLPAAEVYNHIIKMQRKTGMPYIMHRDSCNIKSNQKHQGRIYTNLCQEILEHADKDEIASCNLASINLRKFVKNGSFLYDKLGKIVSNIVENLNKVIDHNYYPLDKRNNDGEVIKQGKISKTNFDHRPIGIGVSGFAEMLYKLDLCFDSNEVKSLNKKVFACIYFNALAKSIQLGIYDGVYKSFKGSPLSTGKLQFDLWKDEFDMYGQNKLRKKEDDEPINPTEWYQTPITLYNSDEKVIDTIEPTWESLRKCVVKYGCRNSLLIALMPTATTAQKLRNTETTEAPMSNLYSRKVMNGAFPVLNRYLEKDLTVIGLWNDITLNYITEKEGSIKDFDVFVYQNSHLFPEFNKNYERLKYLINKYKTIWEIPQKLFLQLAADRARYICQSQSLNLYLSDPTNEQLKAVHVTSHMLGLKTGLYYLRTQSATQAIKFTVDTTKTKQRPKECVEDENGVCLMCQ
jgi:ribonucleoside-diphosphate reductase alpha subunit